MEATALHTIDARVRDFWPDPSVPPSPTKFLTRSATRDPVEIERIDFFDNRDKVLRMLSRRGITPIAIMPEKIWDRLRKSVDLHVLRVDGDVRTVPLYPATMAARATPEFVTFRGTAETMALLGGVALTIATGSFAYMLIPPISYGGNVILALFAAIACGCIGAIASIPLLMRLIPAQRALRTTGWLGRRRARHLASKAMMPFTPLIGAVQLQEFDGVGRRVDVTMTLPTPPADIDAVLDRTRGMNNLSVALLDGAARFEPSIASVLADAILPGSTTFSEVYQEEFKRDPIVFCKIGNAVGLIAQWGDCPIEIDTVRRAFNLDAR